MIDPSLAGSPSGRDRYDDRFDITPKGQQALEREDAEDRNDENPVTQFFRSLKRGKRRKKAA